MNVGALCQRFYHFPSTEQINGLAVDTITMHEFIFVAFQLNLKYCSVIAGITAISRLNVKCYATTNGPQVSRGFRGQNEITAL